MATFGESTVSARAKSRPAVCGIPMVLKKCGVTGFTAVPGHLARLGRRLDPGGRSSCRCRGPAIGRKLTRRGALHAGDGGDSRQHVGEEAAELLVGVVALARTAARAPVSTPSVRMPGSTFCSAMKLRINKPAPASSTSDKRDFRDHQRAERATRARSTAVTAAFAQRVVRVAGGEHRRDDAEDQAGHERQHQREAAPPAYRARPDRAAAPECDRPRA